MTSREREAMQALVESLRKTAGALTAMGNHYKVGGAATVAFQELGTVTLQSILDDADRAVTLGREELEK